MAGYVPARMSGSVQSSVSVLSTLVESRRAATAPFQDFLQDLRETLSHRIAELAELDEKYVQREVFVA